MLSLMSPGSYKARSWRNKSWVFTATSLSLFYSLMLGSPESLWIFYAHRQWYLKWFLSSKASSAIARSLRYYNLDVPRTLQSIAFSKFYLEAADQNLAVNKLEEGWQFEKFKAGGSGSSSPSSSSPSLSPYSSNTTCAMLLMSNIFASAGTEIVTTIFVALATLGITYMAEISSRWSAQSRGRLESFSDSISNCRLASVVKSASRNSWPLELFHVRERRSSRAYSQEARIDTGTGYKFYKD